MLPTPEELARQVYPGHNIAHEIGADCIRADREAIARCVEGMIAAPPLGNYWKGFDHACHSILDLLRPESPSEKKISVTIKNRGRMTPDPIGQVDEEAWIRETVGLFEACVALPFNQANLQTLGNVLRERLPLLKGEK